MTDKQISMCKECKAVDTIRMLALEVVDYAMVAERGKLVVSHAEDHSFSDEQLAARGMIPKTLYYCESCQLTLTRTQILIRESSYQDRTDAVAGVVRLLRAAGLTEVGHEWRDHISIYHQGYYIHWGTTNETWGADVFRGESYDIDAGNLSSDVDSYSVNPYEIFAGIYKPTLDFLKEHS